MLPRDGERGTHIGGVRSPRADRESRSADRDLRLTAVRERNRCVGRFLRVLTRRGTEGDLLRVRVVVVAPTGGSSTALAVVEDTFGVVGLLHDDVHRVRIELFAGWWRWHQEVARELARADHVERA